LLLPERQKRSAQVERPPQLDTPEQVKRSLEEDYALGVRARRVQEENVALTGEVTVERERFELKRDKIYLSLELIVIAIVLAIALLLLINGHGQLTLAVLGGSAGFGGIATLLHHRRGPD
jgi:hypothetical protein